MICTLTFHCLCFNLKNYLMNNAARRGTEWLWRTHKFPTLREVRNPHCSKSVSQSVPRGCGVVKPVILNRTPPCQTQRLVPSPPQPHSHPRFPPIPHLLALGAEREARGGVRRSKRSYTHVCASFIQRAVCLIDVPIVPLCLIDVPIVPLCLIDVPIVPLCLIDVPIVPLCRTDAPIVPLCPCSPTVSNWCAYNPVWDWTAYNPTVSNWRVDVHR